jgi:hypothetical protein
MITTMIEKLVPTMYELNREFRDRPGNLFRVTTLEVACGGGDLTLILRLNLGNGDVGKGTKAERMLAVCRALDRFREASTHEFHVGFTCLSEEEGLIQVELTLVDALDLDAWEPSSEGASMH